MKRFLCLFFVLALLHGLSLPSDAAPGVSAQSALLMDATSGEVLFEHQADTPMAMASTTKIMTALVVLEFANPADIISVPACAVGIEGTSAYLYEGERISVRDLLFALLLQSANDAAIALACHVCENEEAFAQKMNEKAALLGMKNTAFVNPHGLPAEGHYSTARDMAILMQAALNKPQFIAISGAKNHTTDTAGGSAKHYFRNHNRLLSDYEHCIAGKTGYTRAAGRCLVTAAEKEGVRLICATLSAPDDWNDHKNLFEFGFSLYQEHLLYEKGALSYTLSVVGSVDNFVKVSSISDVSLFLQNAENIRVDYDLPHFVYAPFEGLDCLPNGAPIPDGMCAGHAILTQNKREIARVKLYYETGAQAYVPPTLWERILQFFGWKKSEFKNF